MSDYDLGFIETDTGWRASDAQVAWWESRDACPDPECFAIAEPTDTVDGVHRYVCHHPDGEVVTWTREA